MTSLKGIRQVEIEDEVYDKLCFLAQRMEDEPISMNAIIKNMLEQNLKLLNTLASPYRSYEQTMYEIIRFYQDKK
jgi:predicted CopG family antitoxin